MSAETVRLSTDPDGLDCYSDHDEDIRIYGACTVCTSTEPAVVGHVLPDVERVKNADPVDAARMVLSDHSARMFDGVLLDIFTAQYIVAVHDALSVANQTKLRSMSLVKAATVCLKLGAKA